MPQAGFDPPSAEVQTLTEGKFDAFTLQATTAGQINGWIRVKNLMKPKFSRLIFLNIKQQKLTLKSKI